jgi:hypothetical protein
MENLGGTGMKSVKGFETYDFTEFDKQLRDTMREIIEYNKLMEETFNEYHDKFGIEL